MADCWARAVRGAAISARAMASCVRRVMATMAVGNDAKAARTGTSQQGSAPRRDDPLGMPAQHYYTADMVLAIPDDGKRRELVWGELLVSPSPRPVHQDVVATLMFALGQYLRRHRSVGIARSAPADITWGGTDTLVQPDVFVVARAEAHLNAWADIRTLPLVIEVRSPSFVNADRFTKRRRYQDAGVPAYSEVDIAASVVEVWTPDARFPHVEDERLTWHPDGADEPFVLALDELFRPA